jgi:hypothetical protein
LIEGTVQVLERRDTKLWDHYISRMPTTIARAIAIGIPMKTLAAHTGNVQAFLERQLIWLSTLVNLSAQQSLQAHQIEFVATEIYRLWAHKLSLSIEDMAVCFRRGSMGQYGEIYRIDGAIINGWLQKYDSERDAEITKQMMEERENMYKLPPKQEEYGDRDKWLKILSDEVAKVPVPKGQRESTIHKHLRTIAPPPDDTVSKRPKTHEELFEKELHRVYTLANYDPRSGKPLVTHMPEKEWREKNNEAIEEFREEWYATQNLKPTQQSK